MISRNVTNRKHLIITDALNLIKITHYDIKYSLNVIWQIQIFNKTN